MSIEAGRQLLHYRLIEKIGEGGMGVVWKATDTSLGRDVAIKILPETVSEDAERLARFDREAKLLASLNHPNIAAVYGLHEQDGVHFIAMELVPGEDLAQRLARGPLPVAQAVAAAHRIAKALEAAHERGVIHRDLKPANVTLAADGTVKVLDFGLAKAFEPEGKSGPGSPSLSPTLTSAGTVAGMLLGTAAYMSPEQAKGETVDRSADVWAFGVLFYEMLAGQQPFSRKTISETLASVLLSEVDLDALPADTPPVVRSLLARCLIKDPGQRLRDIREARIALENPDASSLYSGVAVASVEVPSTRSRRVPWAVAAAMALVAALALWAPWRSEAPETSPLHLRAGLPAETNLFGLGYGATAVLSPDGSRLAYASGGLVDRTLYVRKLDQLEPKRISGSEGAYHPFFSPDGQWIGFVTRESLKKVSAFGGTPIVLADVSLSRGATWSPDGSIVFTPSSNSGLLRVSEVGGEPEPLTELGDDEFTHRWPQFLPGGKAILFTTHVEGADFDNASIELLDLGSRKRKVLHRGGTYARYAGNGHVVFAREGTLYALPFDIGRLEVTDPPFPVLEGVIVTPGNGGAQFDVSSTGTLVYSTGDAEQRKTQFFKISRDGDSTPLTAEGDAYGNWFDYSPDGRHLAVQIESSLWILDVERGTRSRFTFSDMAEWAPVWSPDGQYLAFASSRESIGNIYRKPADGTGEAERLSESTRQLTPTSWSPDGRFITVSMQSNETGFDIAVVDVEKRELRPVIETRYQDLAASFSPDGRWLVYQSDESGVYEVYVQRFPGPGGKWQVSTAGGRSPRVSSDGSEIFFRAGDKLMAAPVRTEDDRFLVGNPVELLDVPEFFPAFAVAPDAGHFILSRAAGEEGAFNRNHVNLIFDWFRDTAWVQASR